MGMGLWNTSGCTQSRERLSPRRSSTGLPGLIEQRSSFMEQTPTNIPGRLLTAIRERKPLIHHITNMVVMNDTANITLAIGALPVMAHAIEEVEEMVGLAGALVLNIGTLSPSQVEAMLR